MTRYSIIRTRKAFYGLAAALVLALLAGCATPTSPPTAVVPTTVATPSPTVAAPTVVATVSPTTTPTGAPTASATAEPVVTPSATAGTTSTLRRRDQPPAGVAAELEFIATGIAGVCLSNPDEPESIDIDRVGTSAAQEIGTAFFICFKGFAADQPVDAQVTRPDGTTEQKQIAPNPGLAPTTGYYWIWYSRAGDAMGEYQVSATQGDLQAQGTFTVQAATAPRVMLVSESVQRGDTLAFTLAGFSAGQPVPLYLYYRSETECSGRAPCWKYATALPPVTADARGEGTATLATQPDDPAGLYRVVSNPPDQFRILGGSMFGFSE